MGSNNIDSLCIDKNILFSFLFFNGTGLYFLVFIFVWYLNLWCFFKVSFSDGRLASAGGIDTFGCHPVGFVDTEATLSIRNMFVVESLLRINLWSHGGPDAEAYISSYTPPILQGPRVTSDNLQRFCPETHSWSFPALSSSRPQF